MRTVLHRQTNTIKCKGGIMKETSCKYCYCLIGFSGTEHKDTLCPECYAERNGFTADDYAHLEEQK